MTAATFGWWMTSNLPTMRATRVSPPGHRMGRNFFIPLRAAARTLGIDIWMFDLEKRDSPAVNLSQHQGEDTQAAWSPDGKLIAFTNRGANGNDLRQLYLMNSDGTNIQRLSRGVPGVFADLVAGPALSGVCDFSHQPLYHVSSHRGGWLRLAGQVRYAARCWAGRGMLPIRPGRRTEI